MAEASFSGTTLIVSSRPGPGRAKVCEPITVGVPLPRGAVHDPHRIGLVGCGRMAAFGGRSSTFRPPVSSPQIAAIN
jgi:hypothetical protein